MVSMNYQYPPDIANPDGSPAMLLDLLKNVYWDEKKAMAKLYRIREDIDVDEVMNNTPIGPCTQQSASAEEVSARKLKKDKTPQEPIRRSPRTPSLTPNYARKKMDGRVRPRLDCPSSQSSGEERRERHAHKRRKLVQRSTMTPVTSGTPNIDRSLSETPMSFELEKRLGVIDRGEAEEALKAESDTDASDEKEQRQIARITEASKKADHTTVTPWIGMLAGGLYVKTLVVTDELDSAMKDKDGVVANYKRKGQLKSLIDITVNREKLWKEGWDGKHATNVIKFLGEPTWKTESKRGYKAVDLDGEVLMVGDCVVVRPGVDDAAQQSKKKKKQEEKWASQIWFGRVVSMFYDSSITDEDDREQVHVRWFSHGGDSFLCETAGPRELFLITRCDTIPLFTVAGKVQVDKITTAGPIETDPKFQEVNHYFYRFHDDETEGFPHCWEDASLHDDDPETAIHIESEQEECYSCNKDAQRLADGLARGNKHENPLTNEVTKLWWDGKQYDIGDFAYIQLEDLSKPFDIGRIIELKSAPVRAKARRINGDLTMEEAFDVHVQVFKRYDKFAEDYFKVAMEYGEHTPRDARRLYQTPSERKYVHERLMGKCHVVHGDRGEDLKAYTLLPDTFYVLDMVPEGVGRSHGRWKKDDLQPLSEADFKDSCEPNVMANEARRRKEEFASAGRKLLAMDVFAGCGGLTHGLDGGGAVETRWAIEWDSKAAATFKHNFPHATVYNEDVNRLLHQARKEEAGIATKPLRGRNGKVMPKMPKRGEVDFLYGGPPCQDFSGANRFRKSNSIKNSLLTVFLSLLDHYQPAHFMLENVRDMLHHRLGSTQVNAHQVKGGIESGTVKFILRALTSLGYSAQYNVMQAAELGSPQSRRRVFFQGTRLGIRLPLYPQPTHVCGGSKEAVSTHTKSRGYSAPHAMVSVGDAIADLPAFDWGVVIPEDDKQELKERARHVRQATYPLDKAPAVAHAVGRPAQKYKSPPLSLYQSWLRSGKQSPGSLIKNHYTIWTHEAGLLRTMSIPLGLCTNHSDSLNPSYFTDGFHGRVRKAPAYYVKRYQRLDWKGCIGTVMTVMDPTSQACLHPSQRRVLSVREYARMQGFPDWFEWDDGTDANGKRRERGWDGEKGAQRAKDMVRQIGNAVSGCHGLALGKAIFEVEYERWAKEGKPVMERKVAVRVHSGVSVPVDPEDDSIYDVSSGDEDGAFEDDEYGGLGNTGWYHQKIKRERHMRGTASRHDPIADSNRLKFRPVVELNAEGSNKVVVVSHSSKYYEDEDDDFKYSCSNKKKRNADLGFLKDRQLSPFEEGNEDNGNPLSDDDEDDDEDGDALFVTQPDPLNGAPLRDEVDDEEFELLLAQGRFDDVDLGQYDGANDQQPSSPELAPSRISDSANDINGTKEKEKEKVKKGGRLGGMNGAKVSGDISTKDNRMGTVTPAGSSSPDKRIPAVRVPAVAVPVKAKRMQSRVGIFAGHVKAAITSTVTRLGGLDVVGSVNEDDVHMMSAVEVIKRRKSGVHATRR